MHALRTDDVIVAISTPPGDSVRGILRLTGPAAVELSAQLFAAEHHRPLATQRPWRMIPGRLRLDRDLAVPCNAVVFLPPRSYTGQPLVELHLAGSSALLSMALRSCTAAGARVAEPGEFTARAFLTGRMDLLAAEGVAARIAARSDAQLVAARQMANGTLAERVRAATENLTDLLSLIEAGIDFADEPVEFIHPEAVASRLAAMARDLEDLLARSLDMQRLEALPRVALVGPPNTGKSRLLNRLTGLDRCICSPIPGTTRDVLSAVMDTPAGQVFLLDGPGLGPPRSEIDRMAQRAWRDVLGRVDLVLLVLAADELRFEDRAPHGQPQDEEDAFQASVASRPHMMIVNKQDLLSRDEQAALKSQLTAGGWQSANGEDAGTLFRWLRTTLGVHVISAATGSGCRELQETVGAAVAGLSTSGAGRIVLTARHGQALHAALDAIRSAAREHCAELIALSLREALMQLGQITGQVTTEDLLDRVFSRFCIGK
jgi:tRNA modification GTPase